MEETVGFLPKSAVPVAGAVLSRGVHPDHSKEVFVQVTQANCNFAAILFSPDDAEDLAADLIRWARIARENPNA